MSAWLTVKRGEAPLVVSFPHTGTDIPPELDARLVSPWLSRKDADWWVDRLYDFAHALGATTVHTAISRTVTPPVPRRATSRWAAATRCARRSP